MQASRLGPCASPSGDLSRKALCNSAVPPKYAGDHAQADPHHPLSTAQRAVLPGANPGEGRWKKPRRWNQLEHVRLAERHARSGCAE
jgi:hypothetical protein